MGARRAAAKMPRPPFFEQRRELRAEQGAERTEASRRQKKDRKLRREAYGQGMPHHTAKRVE